MRRNRPVKLHDIKGFVKRMLVECDERFLSGMNESDRIDLETGFAAKLLHVKFQPKAFLPF